MLNSFRYITILLAQTVLPLFPETKENKKIFEDILTSVIVSNNIGMRMKDECPSKSDANRENKGVELTVKGCA